METLKNMLYATLGLAQQNNEAFKEKYEELVKVGKIVDENGKNYVNDFVKILEENKETLGEKYNDQLTKVEELIKSLKVTKDSK